MFSLDASCLATTDFIQISRVIPEIFSTPPRAILERTLEINWTGALGAKDLLRVAKWVGMDRAVIRSNYRENNTEIANSHLKKSSKPKNYAEMELEARAYEKLLGKTECDDYSCVPRQY
jgi:hypothetical protein